MDLISLRLLKRSYHVTDSQMRIGLLIISTLLAACTGAGAPGGTTAPQVSSPPTMPTPGWITYKNTTFGLSFRYPSSMILLNDQPDTSGVQFQEGALRLTIVVNPRTATTVEEFGQQLRNSGFRERHRASLLKGPWNGLRLEGIAKDRQFGFEVDEVVYMVKSGDSLLTLLALWSEPPPNYQVVDALWESLELQFDSFALSPALTDIGSMTTFRASDGSFTLRYPTLWQAAMSESKVTILNLSDPNAVLITVKHDARQGLGLSEAMEKDFGLIRTGFSNVVISSEQPYSIAGDLEAILRTGVLEFNAGADGACQLIIAISENDIIAAIAIYQSSEAGAVQRILESIVPSLETR